MLKKMLILFVIPFVLCACAKDNREEITFVSWGSITEVKIINKIIVDFEQKNPSIKVNFIHIPQNYFQKLHLLFASSQEPDVIFINNLNLPIFASKLDDLSALINQDEYYSQSLDSLSFDGKLLAVPRDISTLVFYRNKTYIKTIPENLEDFKSAISLVPQGKFGVSYERNMYYLFPYILTLGESIYEPEKSLEFYRHLEGKYAPTPAQIGSLTQAQMFMNGQIALYLSGRWMYPKIKENADFDWDVITFPGIVPLDTSGWAISANSKHKDSAKKFVKYLGSDVVSEYFLSTGLLVPAKIEISKKIDAPIFLEAIHKSKVLPIGKDYNKQIDRLNQKLFD